MDNFSIGDLIQVAGISMVYATMDISLASSKFWITTLGMFLIIIGSRIIQEYKNGGK